MKKIFFILSICLLVPGLFVSSQGLAENSSKEPALSDSGFAGSGAIQNSCDERCRRKAGGFAKSWQHSLPEEFQAKAQAILQEAIPEITQLRRALREKVDALADLNYDEVTPPEKLLQLGRELQELRNALNERLARLDSDLRNAVGSSPKSLRKLGRHQSELK